MKTTLKIATVLTWINLVVWGACIVLCLLFAIAMQALPLIVVLVLVSAIPLNCYAALQLQKSIRQPAIKLSSQTPTGIRFVGFIAIFFGINFVGEGIAIMQDARHVLEATKEQMKQIKGADMSVFTENYIRGLGIVALVLGIFICVNVVLNFRLLRWYYLVRQSDVS